MVGDGDFAFEEDLLLNVVQTFFVESGHVESVVEEGSDSRVGREFFVLLVHFFVLHRGFYVEGSNEMFVPFFNIVEFEHFC